MQILQYIFIILFLALSIIPFCLTLFDVHPKDVLLRENRALAEKPSLKETPFKDWPKVLDTWFQDRLVFRGYYVCLYLKLWEEWLSAPVAGYTTGYDNEVYYTPTLEHYLGLTPITPEEYAYFKLAHAGLYAFLKSKNIPYVFITIPDKTTLYPEFLPFWVHWCKGESWYDQFTKAIVEIGVPWVDLFPTFKEKKVMCKVYNKNFDTLHMNAYGVEICYQEIENLLSTQFPQLVSKPLDKFYNIFWEKVTITKLLKEKVPIIQLLRTDRFQPTEIPGLVTFEENYWHKPRLIINNNPLSPLNIWLVTDSYFLLSGHQQRDYPVFRGDLPLLAYHVKNLFKTHVQFFHSSLFRELLKKGPYPDLVIETIVERNNLTIDRAKKDSFVRIAGDMYLDTPGHLLTPDNVKNHYIYI